MAIPEPPPQASLFGEEEMPATPAPGHTPRQTRAPRPRQAAIEALPGLFDTEDPPFQAAVGIHWPDAARFPLNIDRDRTVGRQVTEDLRTSQDALLIAGYSALDHLVELMADPQRSGGLRLLFGSEPTPARTDRLGLATTSFPAEVERYWLQRNISLRLSGRLIEAIELLRSGKVQARYLGEAHRRLHAKMYCGDEAITLGSSNYTEPGLRKQIEANVRFTRKTDKARYADARQIAENFWNQGTEYTAELIGLLEQLLRVVDWQEALARACAELLEGDWAKTYLKLQLLPGEQPLWPSQELGIAQALWLMETLGSVLVADATGSGKTRMGAHLLRAVFDRIWSGVRAGKGFPVMVCPPSVKANWEREVRRCQMALNIQSHGSLSHAAEEVKADAREAIRRAQVLAVDEAHNFLNPKSKRTRLLLGNLSDHTLLFTATPINKSAVDLLRLADMLGADNFDEPTLAMFEKLLKRRGKFSTLSTDELDQLRSAIQRFTVRRTKRQLNQLVDERPEAYRDNNGRLCRYPRHKTETYSLEDAVPDGPLAAQIRAAAQELTGIGLIHKPIEFPESMAHEGMDEARYLRARLLGARKLAEYLVMSALRSSKVALLEHLIGTAEALQVVQLHAHAKSSSAGAQIRKLRERAGQAPGCALQVEAPAWLTDEAAHRAAVAVELATYERILNLARKLSTTREEIKSQHLLGLLDGNAQIIAFDSKPITLAYLKQVLEQKLPAERVILATGEHVSGKKDVREKLAPGSAAKGIIALCSDAMSEGINLQQASAMVHLDLPSVVRIAEQRLGRVDRMDSPHEQIEAWWPQDGAAFGLRRDERFFFRLDTVHSLIGSNLPVPEELLANSGTGDVVNVLELAKESEEIATTAPWDGVQDAFSPVRELVAGPTALVAADTYRHYRHVKARVLSRVSLVRTASPWAFFCVAGTRTGAPHWVLIDPHQGQPLTQLPEIATALRLLLSGKVQSLKLNAQAVRELDRMLTLLAQHERQLLPRRKQRALEEMEFILARYEQDALAAGDVHTRLQLHQLLLRFGPQYKTRSLDWDAVAEGWLELIRPVWYEKLKRPRRLRPVKLRDIRQELLTTKKLDTAKILATFQDIRTLPSVEARIVACIIGVAA